MANTDVAMIWCQKFPVAIIVPISGLEYAKSGRMYQRVSFGKLAMEEQLNFGRIASIGEGFISKMLH